MIKNIILNALRYLALFIVLVSALTYTFMTYILDFIDLALNRKLEDNPLKELLLAFEDIYGQHYTELFDRTEFGYQKETPQDTSGNDTRKGDVSEDPRAVVPILSSGNKTPLESASVEVPLVEEGDSKAS